MARKKSSIPPSVRLRENQRRSRASHKAYVSELQAKVAWFEQRGVQASLALQQAARSVARENRLLRELLALKGVEESEVDAFVGMRDRGGDVEGGCEGSLLPSGGRHGTTAAATCASASDGRTPAASTPATTESGTAFSQCLHSWQDLSVSQGTRTKTQTPCNSSLQGSAAHPRLGLPILNPNTTKNPSSTPDAAAASSTSSRGLEMSCQEAAAIIAAMRGGRYLYGDVDASVRSELGCDADALLESCRVGNVRLMDVMDGEGGSAT